MKKCISTLTAILILLAPIYAWAATYYVGQKSAGARNGISYANRMSVSTHNSSNFEPGDTIFLCDTITSRIIVPDSGSSGNVITYRGDYAGHASDLNIADGGSGQISYTQKDYITFQSLTLRNGSYGITSVGGSDHIIIKKCTIHDNSVKGIHFHGTYGENSYVTIGGASGDGNTIYNISTTTAGTDVMLSHVSQFIVSHNTLYGTGALGVDGIATEYASYGVIEYNKIYDHPREDGIDFKENSHHIITRFNNIYGHPNQSGITVQRGSYNMYIYGNQVYDTSYGAIYIKRGDWSGHNVENIYIWSNLLYDNEMVGVAVSSSGTSSSAISNVRIYNNVIASSGTASATYLNTGIDIRYGSGHVVKNNIFFGNTGTSGREYAQMYVASGYTTGVTFQYNQGYYAGQQTAKVYWGARGLLNFDSATAGSNNVLSNPGFTNEPGNDYTLLGISVCKDTGVDLSGLVGSVTIQGTTHNMYYNDGLDDSYVDFSTSPPTVREAKQEDYGSWEKGAYIYIEGGGANEAPDGTIAPPANIRALSN